MCEDTLLPVWAWPKGLSKWLRVRTLSYSPHRMGLALASGRQSRSPPPLPPPGGPVDQRMVLREEEAPVVLQIEVRAHTLPPTLKHW